MTLIPLCHSTKLEALENQPCMRFQSHLVTGLSKVDAKIPSSTRALNSAVWAQNPRPALISPLPTPLHRHQPSSLGSSMDVGRVSNCVLKLRETFPLSPS